MNSSTGDMNSGSAMAHAQGMCEAHGWLEQVLFEPKVEVKLAALDALERSFLKQERIPSYPGTPRPAEAVAFPLRPLRVEPRRLKRRSLREPEGLRVFLHALAHIEFNAILLAVDAAYRFTALPDEFRRDWLRVALDEGRHYRAILARMESLGATYGDYPAHGGLWELAVKTAHDSLARMAVIPRFMEARGLDVAPAMIESLDAIEDTHSASLLRMILREEVAHVETGSRWFKRIALDQGKDPESHYFALLDVYLKGAIRGPFNVTARRQAGFSEREIEGLSQKAALGAAPRPPSSGPIASGE